MKYVWLDLNTGEFSNTFSQEDVDLYIRKEDVRRANQQNWKLIRYECVNDEDFEFYNRMQITFKK